MSCAPGDRLVELSFFGEPRWRGPRGSGELARQDAALLGWLAASGPQPRDLVVSWLWPRSTPQRGRLSLRQRLFKLRQLIGHPLVVAGALVRLDPAVGTDLGTSLPADGEFLGRFDYGDLDDFDRWVSDQREWVERQRLDTLAGEAARLEAQGSIAQALLLCDRILARRATLEHVWRRLMRLHAARGDRAAAVAAFERFEAQVCRELGLAPSHETLALLDAIERSQPQATAGPLPPALLRPPRLIGRERELQRLRQAWQAGHAVLVLGEGGIGKSRLIEALLGERPGALLVRARPGDAAMPYATLTHVMAAAWERHAPQLAGPDRRELGRLLPELGPASEAPARQARLWRAVEALFVACAANGLAAVAVDDLHHADEASLELAAWLLASERLSALQWAFAARAGESAAGAPGLQRWLGESLRIEPVRLGPLTLEQVESLVTSLALPGLSAEAPALAPALMQHAGGHPFFTLETLKSALLEGTAPGAAWPLSAAAQALVTRRLEALSAPARELLRLLSIVDGEAHAELAAQALGVPAATLAGAWGELAAAQLVSGARPAHDLVRDSVLAGWPEPARRPLHAALARALAAGGAPAAERAAHWQAARDDREAARAWREAASQARRSGRLLEQERLLVAAADAAAAAGLEDERVDALCHALQARMLRLGASAVLAPVRDELARAQRPHARGFLQTIACEALLNLGRAAEALDAGAQALAALQPGTQTHHEARVLHARALALTGHADEAIAALERARAQASPEAGRTGLMQLEAALAHALFAAHRTSASLQAQQRALALAEDLGDATEVAHHQANLATIAFNAGENAVGLAAARAAHARLTAMGARDGHFAVNALTLSRFAIDAGRLDEAAQALDAAAGVGADRVGHTIHALVTVGRLGLHLLLGEPAAALGCADELAALPDAELQPVAQAASLLARLRLSVAVGHDPRTEAAALQALGAREPGLRANAVLYREWARWDPPLEARRRLAALAAAASTPVVVSLSLKLVALDLAMPGSPQAAARLAAQALRLRRRWHEGHLAAGYPPENWALLARVLDAGGEPEAAAACRREARDWIDAVTLPAATPEARQRFRTGHAANRALLSEAAGPGPGGGR